MSSVVILLGTMRFMGRLKLQSILTDLFIFQIMNSQKCFFHQSHTSGVDGFATRLGELMCAYVFYFYFIFLFFIFYFLFFIFYFFFFLGENFEIRKNWSKQSNIK